MPSRHTHPRSYMHTPTQAHSRTCAHSHACMHLCVCAVTHARTFTVTRTHNSTYALPRTHTHTCPDTCTLPYTGAHTYTCTNALTNSHCLTHRVADAAWHIPPHAARGRTAGAGRLPRLQHRPAQCSATRTRREQKQRLKLNPRKGKTIPARRVLPSGWSDESAATPVRRSPTDPCHTCRKLGSVAQRTSKTGAESPRGFRWRPERAIPAGRAWLRDEPCHAHFTKATDTKTQRMALVNK